MTSSREQAELLNPTGTARRKGLVFWIRLAIGILTLAGLGWAARSSFRQLIENPPNWSAINWGLLVLAVCVTGASQTMAAWFWRKVLISFGYPVPFTVASTAFFCSQFGKYVPGKALVVVIRAVMVRDAGVPMKPAVASVFVETLMWVAAGALTGLAALALSGAGSWWMNLISIAMAIGVGFATTPPIFGLAVRFIANRRATNDESASIAPTWKIWGLGVAVLFAGWLVAGCGMSLVLNAIGPRECGWNDLPVCVAAVSLATVVGFVTLIPGGLGVRELVILPLIASVFPERQALIAAIMFRLVTMGAELSMTVIMYGLKSSFSRRQNPQRNI